SVHLFSHTCPRRLPRSTLCPYTTLFRSLSVRRRRPWPPRRETATGVPRGPPCRFSLSPDSPARPAPAERRAVLQPLAALGFWRRSEEHTSELQSRSDLVCRLLLEKKKTN